MQPSPNQDREPQRTGQHRDESGQSGAERSAQRVQRPGEAGLANEARPGLGTRADPTLNQRDQQGRGALAAKSGNSDAEKQPAAKKVQPRSASDQGADTSHPAPREQDSQSLAQEQQRDTGVSGHTSGS